KRSTTGCDGRRRQGDKVPRTPLLPSPLRRSVYIGALRAKLSRNLRPLAPSPLRGGKGWGCCGSCTSNSLALAPTPPPSIPPLKGEGGAGAVDPVVEASIQGRGGCDGTGGVSD